MYARMHPEAPLCDACTGKLSLSVAQQAAAWAESPAHAEVLVMAGGAQLMDWLLATAANEESTDAQLHAEHALLSLLRSGMCISQSFLLAILRCFCGSSFLAAISQMAATSDDTLA